MTRIEEITEKVAQWRLYRDDGMYSIGHITLAEAEYLLAENKRLRETLTENAVTFDNLADILDGWAEESRRGSWSTHQVSHNEAQANYCRRDAAETRAALSEQS